MNQWSQIEWLVDGEGEITIGRMGGIPCAAVAADGHNALAMLVRRRGESLDDLLTRLDDAIRLAVEEDTYTDEING
jgi:ribosome assembly protein YihI (activator of Der GTPase)